MTARRRTPTKTLRKSRLSAGIASTAAASASRVAEQAVVFTMVADPIDADDQVFVFDLEDGVQSAKSFRQRQSLQGRQALEPSWPAVALDGIPEVRVPLKQRCLGDER